MPKALAHPQPLYSEPWKLRSDEAVAGDVVGLVVRKQLTGEEPADTVCAGRHGEGGIESATDCGVPLAAPRRSRSRSTVAEAAERWLQLYVSTARSAKNAGMAAQRVRDFLVPTLGHIPVDAMLPDDVRIYRLDLEKRGLAPRTVRHLLTDLRCLLRWAVEARLLVRTPFPRGVMPRIQERPPDRLNDAQVLALLRIPEPQSFVVRLGLATGMRWGELCRAQAEHVERGMIVVSNTKSGRVRRIPLDEVILSELLCRQGRLVPYGEGSAGSFNDYVGRLSGVAGFHVHQLRHTFSCRWIERGGSLPALQQVLGHASVVTTQQYARLSDEHVRREAARISGTSGWNFQPALSPTTEGAG